MLLLALTLDPSVAMAGKPRLGHPLREHPRRGLDSTSTGIPRYKLNSVLGMTICQGTGLTLGAQFGYAPFGTRPLYVGPEIDFAFFSPGSVLATLATAWYEIPISHDEKFSISAGAVLGPGFTTGLSGFATTTTVAMFDATVAREIDDLFSLRGQVRAGVIGDSFALMVNLNVSFRFY